jgi:hypothetical protein
MIEFLVDASAAIFSTAALLFAWRAWIHASDVREKLAALRRDVRRETGNPQLGGP